jgi:hypothetical protein
MRPHFHIQNDVHFFNYVTDIFLRVIKCAAYMELNLFFRRLARVAAVSRISNLKKKTLNLLHGRNKDMIKLH